MLSEILLRMVEVEQEIAGIVNDIKKAKESEDKKRLSNELVRAEKDLEVIEGRLVCICNGFYNIRQVLNWLENLDNN